MASGVVESSFFSSSCCVNEFELLVRDDVAFMETDGIDRYSRWYGRFFLGAPIGTGKKSVAHKLSFVLLQQQQQQQTPTSGIACLRATGSSRQYGTPHTLLLTVWHVRNADDERPSRAATPPRAIFLIWPQDIE
jgi:hypothetical protein